MELSTKEYLELDLGHVWHPFTQHKDWSSRLAPLVIDRAEGVYLYDSGGNRYLDGVSSLWCNVHGHSVPELVETIQVQSQKLCHSTILGLSHTPLLELTKRLIPVLPSNLNRLFYADSGTTAVEAALRIAIEWWQKKDNAKARKKTKFASLEGAYHGDTLGAVGLGFLESFHKDLSSVVVPAMRVPPPFMFRLERGCSEDESTELSLNYLRELFEKSSDEIAAFVIEPRVQGATGIWVQQEKYLKGVESLCREFEVLLIADEVATGFGKTGELFAVDHGLVKPDLMILGKGLSAGYLPISAVAATEELFEGFIGEPEEGKTFYYGQTFAGNPLAAAVASKNLDLISENRVIEKLKDRLPFYQGLLDEHIKPLEKVYEVRSCGLMVGVELTQTPEKLEPFSPNQRAGIRIVEKAREMGLIIRPLGNVMVLMPPLVMEEAELEFLVKTTAEAITAAI